MNPSPLIGVFFSYYFIKHGITIISRKYTSGRSSGAAQTRLTCEGRSVLKEAHYMFTAQFVSPDGQLVIIIAATMEELRIKIREARRG